MPTYTYKCTENGHQFEVRQRMADAPLSECPVCEGPVRRVVGSVGVVFKGSGFYVTDNRDRNGNGAKSSTNGSHANGDHANDGAKESESTKKTESQPAKEKVEKATATAVK
jgi:putative FmdB family regulatory protein